MMFGMGAATTTGSTVPTTSTPTSGAAGSASTIPSFSTGLQLWESPSSAIKAAQTLLSNPSAAFSGSFLPFTMGVFLPPLALIGVVIFAMNRGGR